MESLSSWIAGQVPFADEAIVEYIAGLCFDETLDAGEVTDAVHGIFEAENADSHEFIPLLLKEAEKARIADKESKEAEEQEQLQKRKAAAEAVALSAIPDEPPQSEAPKKSSSQGLSKAELKARQQLLEKYGFEADEIVENENGEAEIVYRASGSEKPSVAGLEKNRNADIVKSIEQAKREKSAAEHAKQIQKNKELIEKQKLEKEKEKRRTQKREKRRM
ncbi:hypothetical protein BJ742DRAFT_850105 [Cladochytrium replicatum]|nr:hypothetical protein BJ742DRAFT_850105 [Cladochytrium replicatum]